LQGVGFGGVGTAQSFGVVAFAGGAGNSLLALAGGDVLPLRNDPAKGIARDLGVAVIFASAARDRERRQRGAADARGAPRAFDGRNGVVLFAESGQQVDVGLVRLV